MTPIATPHAVFNAANELQTDGHAVTIHAVIAKLGGGSKSTVAPLLAAWHLTRHGANQSTSTQ